MELFVQYAPVIGLLFFFIVFIAICVLVMLPGSRSRLEDLAKIPLKEAD